MNHIRIAMAQIHVVSGDKEGNFRRIEYAIEDSLAEGATLICFPETCLLGWTNPWAHHRAATIPGPDTARLSSYARQSGAFLSIGIEEHVDGRTYDSAVLINPEGEILLTHRKINLLTELMTPPYTPGETIDVSETSLGRIAMVICADTFLEEILQTLKALRPDLVLIPFGWAEREEAWPAHADKLHHVISHTAHHVGAPVVGTNSIGRISSGPWEGRVFGGQSLAVHPHGDWLAHGRDRDRDIVVFDLPRA